MSEVEQRREQLPGAGSENRARLAKARRNAWFLAGLAAFFYVAYMAWMVMRANGGV